MSYEIRINIPEDSHGGHLIASLVDQQHATPNQVVEGLIDEAARQLHVPHRRRIPGLPDEPISAEEAAEVDEAMAIVMAARRERSERMFGA